jgi:capsular polysaccharide transport system ATP-binding protein
MIELQNLSKRYPTRHGEVTVLNEVNLTIQPGEKLGILGRNGAGKSTLIRLLGGVEQPSTGRVVRSMSVSWPLAFSGGFQGSLTGLDNLRFICRVYGTSTEDKIDFVQEFSELGLYLREPVKSYSAGMRARLAFALSMVIEFDCFLIDEVVAVGDQRFTEKCNIELFQKRRDRAMVFVSHQRTYIESHCDRAAVLHGGRLHEFKQVQEAFAYYEQTQHQ